MFSRAEDSVNKVECAVSESDPIVLGSAKYERFGIALHPTKQVLKRNLDRVHFHLYPKLTTPVGLRSWVHSATKRDDKPVYLTLHHSPALKSHHGIRIEDTQCFKDLIKILKGVKTYDVVKTVNSTERVRLIGDIRVTP